MKPEYLDDFNRIVKALHSKGEITEAMKEHLIGQAPATYDEMEQCLHEMFEAIKNKDMYLLMERIEKGTAIRDAETDPMKKQRYTNALKAMTVELENILARIQKGA